MRKGFAIPEVGCVSAWPSRARNRSPREEPMSGGLKLEKASTVRVFTFSNLKVIARSAAARVLFLEAPKCRSFLYRLDGDRWTEVRGFLSGDKIGPQSPLTWRRVKAGAGTNPGRET